MILFKELDRAECNATAADGGAAVAEKLLNSDSESANALDSEKLVSEQPVSYMNDELQGGTLTIIIL